MTVDMTWWIRLSDSVRAAGHGDAPLDEPIRMIRDGLGFDCAALVGPPRVTLENSYPVLVNLDYPSETLRFIATTYATQCPAHRYAVERRAALRFIDLPYDFRQSRTYREALKPCGFNEGLTLPLNTPRGATVPGFLALSSTHGQPLHEESQLALTMHAAEIAKLTDPRPELPASPAELVIWSGHGRVEPRIGDLATAPLTAKDFTRIETFHQRDATGLRFRHRDATGHWWRVTTATTPDGVLIRLQRVDPDDHLTARELDVVGLLSRGWTNDGIALALGISVRTARSHIESALTKLGVPNRTALAREALLRDLDSLNAIRCTTEDAPT